MYLGSSVSSTESDVNIRLTIAWTAIDWLSITWKFDLYHKIKRFLPGSSCVNTTLWIHHMDADKTSQEKAR